MKGWDPNSTNTTCFLSRLIPCEISSNYWNLSRWHRYYLSLTGESETTRVLTTVEAGIRQYIFLRRQDQMVLPGKLSTTAVSGFPAGPHGTTVSKDHRITSSVAPSLEASRIVSTHPTPTIGNLHKQLWYTWLTSILKLLHNNCVQWQAKYLTLLDRLILLYYPASIRWNKG